ncbi:MAG TPA: penicillin-binding protein 2 [Bacteroidales bacterium]|nr:penicillin-binding protein 2 [Bacteroidales bacterium]
MVQKKIFENRKFVVSAIVIAAGLIFVIRLFYVQIINEKYVLSANNNVLRYEVQYPARGLVLDRNGELLVYNEAAYDLMVVPRLVKNPDTTEFCSLLDISCQEFRKRLQKARSYSMHKPSIFVEQVSKEQYGFIEERLYKYPGFFVQSRTLRKYPQPSAAHTLGYIGEVSPAEIEANPYYKSADYIGKSGIEKSYENTLRGKKGMRISMVDVFNRVKGRYMEGHYDSTSIAGNDLFITIDANLQAYGELLMANKKGSIVAIEPATGEILALISSPSYDPNLLIGRVRSKNYNMLSTDSLVPLFNRALLAMYSPGSTFKLVDALVGQQEGVINPSTAFPCAGVGALPIRCSHNHASPLQLIESIEQSCNPYYWSVFKAIIDNPAYGGSTRRAYEKWRQYLLSFNLGKTFNTDLLVERSGNVPEPEYYDKYFGKNVWRSMTIRSLSIGQGELLVTPLQLANFAALVANRGFYYDPHIGKVIVKNRVRTPIEFTRHNTMVEPRHFEPVVEGMRRVFAGSHGTARYYAHDSISMGGKTGTVQNPHGENHSIFIAFAPIDNPKIAIAVVVENAGYGSTFAAPIATLMMMKYLLGDFKPPWFEKKMLETNLID